MKKSCFNLPLFSRRQMVQWESMPNIVTTVTWHCMLLIKLIIIWWWLLILFAVQLSFNSLVTYTRSVQYGYTCNTSNNSHNELEDTTQFVVYLHGKRFTNRSEPSTCTFLKKSVNSSFEHLDCGTSYNISAYFVYVDGNLSDCQVIHTSFKLRTLKSLLDLSCLREYIYNIITLNFLN